MRKHESTNGINQMQETRNSTHIHIRTSHGACHQFLSSALGKTQNKDYEPLHYKDTQT